LAFLAARAHCWLMVNLKTVPIKQNVFDVVTFHLKQNFVFIPEGRT